MNEIVNLYRLLALVDGNNLFSSITGRKIYAGILERINKISASLKLSSTDLYTLCDKAKNNPLVPTIRGVEHYINKISVN